MKELAADGTPVAVTCRVLKLARQPYYRWVDKPVADAVLAQAYRANALFGAHREDPEFGYRFLAGEARDAGRRWRTGWRGGSAGTTAGGACSARNAAAAVRTAGRYTVISSVVTSRRPAPTGCGSPTSPELASGEGKLYLCAIKSVFSKGSWATPSTVDEVPPCVTALDNAVARREHGDGCILHTDRGSRFRSGEFVRALDRPRMAAITGRVGAAGDKAATADSEFRRRTHAAQADPQTQVASIRGLYDVAVEFSSVAAGTA